MQILRRWMTAVVIAGVALSAGAAHAAGQGKAASGPTTGLTEDRGKFRAYLDGQPAATEEFSISRSGSEWVCRGSSQVKLPEGGTEEVSGELRLAGDGSPRAYTWTAKGSKKASGATEFSGNTARMQLQAEGTQGFTQEFTFESGRVLVLDNNLYHHYAVLARLFDWNAKGVQTFSVLIPQDLTPGSITVEWAGPQEFAGTMYDVLRVKSADLDLELYVKGGRLDRIYVPTAKVDVRRE
jgi:hypothetical protein